MLKFSFLTVMVLTISVISCNLSPKIDIQKETPKKKRFEKVNGENPTLSNYRWWEDFKDNNLNLFIKKVTANSLDFKKSNLTVEKFKLLYKISKSNLWPNISLSTGATRTKTNLKTFLPQGGSFKNTNYSFMFNASYEIDVFKKLSNQKQESYFQYLSIAETQNSIKLSIIANASALYFQYSEINEEVELSKEILKIQKLEYNSLYRKYLNGIIPSDLYLNASSALKQTENNLFQLQQSKKEIEKSLKNILSQTNIKVHISNFSKITKSLISVKPGLPSELLLRRPDVRSAYFDLKSKISATGVAKANLFPSIKLTGGDGFKTTELSLLLNQKSNVWNLGFNIFQPIFNRGALKNQVKITEKDLEISLTEYKKTVINAFSEVDFLLNQYKVLKQQIINQQAILNREKTIEKKKFKEYLSGTETYENYLNEKIKLLNQKIMLNKLYLAYVLNRVSLYKSLGGGIEKLNILNTEVAQ